MYSAKVVDVATDELKGIDPLDIQYDGGKVVKLTEGLKCRQQAILVLLHVKRASYAGGNYGSQILVFIGRKSIPYLHLLPLQNSISDSLLELRDQQVSYGLGITERLSRDLTVDTLIQDGKDYVQIEINAKTEKDEPQCLCRWPANSAR